MGLTLSLVNLLLSLNSHCSEDVPDWTIYIANDNCPDYTWGLTEEQTRQSFAEIIRAP